MDIKSKDDLLLYELQDLYSAEQQIVKALPKMVEKAHDPLLKGGLEKHLEETRRQVERLQAAAGELGVDIDGAICKGMEGLLKEGEELMEEEPSELLDQALISAAQRVEHYEIAGYGCAITYAKLLNTPKVADLLRKTLAEEKAADERLTEIAEKEIEKTN